MITESNQLGFPERTHAHSENTYPLPTLDPSAAAAMMAQAYEPAALAPLPNMMSIAMSRPQVGIERLPTRRMSNEPRESMNCKSCRKRKVRNCNRGERKRCPCQAEGTVYSYVLEYFLT